MQGRAHDVSGVWARLAEISPPLDADRPMAAEVRAARDLFQRHAGDLLDGDLRTGAAGVR